MLNIVLIILGFFAIFGLSIYLYTKIHQKYKIEELHYKEREDGIYKFWEANIENLRITIMKNGLGPFYSVFVRRYDVKNGYKRGYIEIASHRGSDLSEAKEIADKMVNIALKYRAPSSIKTNIVKKTPTGLDFKETKDKRGFTVWEADFDKNCSLKIIKSEGSKPYSAFVKMRKQEHGETQGYIEVASHMGTTLSQAKIIVGKLYNITIPYKVPGTDSK